MRTSTPGACPLIRSSGSHATMGHKDIRMTLGSLLADRRGSFLARAEAIGGRTLTLGVAMASYKQPEDCAGATCSKWVTGGYHSQPSSRLRRQSGLRSFKDWSLFW